MRSSNGCGGRYIPYPTHGCLLYSSSTHITMHVNVYAFALACMTLWNLLSDNQRYPSITYDCFNDVPVVFSEPAHPAQHGFYDDALYKSTYTCIYSQTSNFCSDSMSLTCRRQLNIASSIYCTWQWPGLTVRSPTKYCQPMIDVKNTMIGTIHVIEMIINTYNSNYISQRLNRNNQGSVSIRYLRVLYC